MAKSMFVYFIYIAATAQTQHDRWSYWARCWIDIVNTAYHYLDLVPKGRDENGRGPFWVRLRDEYDGGKTAR